MRAAKVQASLRIRAVLPESSLLAHTSSESRGTFRQKARSLAPLNGWACAVKICHDGMLEDTNSLDGAQIRTVCWSRCIPTPSHHSFLSSSLLFLNGRKPGVLGWKQDLADTVSEGSQIIRTVSEGSEIRRTSLYPVVTGVQQCVFLSLLLTIIYCFAVHPLEFLAEEFV